MGKINNAHLSIFDEVFRSRNDMLFIALVVGFTAGIVYAERRHQPKWSNDAEMEIRDELKKIQADVASFKQNKTM